MAVGPVTFAVGVLLTIDEGPRSVAVRHASLVVGGQLAAGMTGELVRRRGCLGLSLLAPGRVVTHEALACGEVRATEAPRVLGPLRAEAL